MESTIRLSQKQNEYLRNAHSRWNIKTGAVRSGKSYVDVNAVIPHRLRSGHGKPGLNLIMGVSRDTIERNVLQPMREQFTDRLIGNINNRNIARICGEDVYCLGAEKVNQVGKIQGMSVKYCYGDEIAKWNSEVFAILQSRLDKPYSCFDGACNPESPTHWLKEFLDNPDIDIYNQHYTIFDNPFLPKSFVDNLCKEYAGTVYYDRLIEGVWALAEGLIYPMYQDVIVSEKPQGTPKKSVLSIDYGTMNAFCALQWDMHNIWYCTNRYYYSGRDTGIQKTDDEYLRDIEQRFAEVIARHRENHVKITVIIDPSAASFIALLKRTDWAKVLPAKNDVLNGIRETATAMNCKRIAIMDYITEYKDEAGGYVWQDGDGEERPIKENDHLMDAMRYMVMTMHVNKQTPQYRPLWMM